jgi:hypothetical protein
MSGENINSRRAALKISVPDWGLNVFMVGVSDESPGLLAASKSALLLNDKKARRPKDLVIKPSPKYEFSPA